jgi:hypothetical protein
MCILLVFADDLSIIIRLTNVAFIYSRSGDQNELEDWMFSSEDAKNWNIFVDLNKAYNLLACFKCFLDHPEERIFSLLKDRILRFKSVCDGSKQRDDNEPSYSAFV